MSGFDSTWRRSIWLWWLGAAVVPAQAPVQTIEPGFEMAEHELIDVDADGRIDLVAVATDGRVRVWRGSGEDTPLEAEPSVQLTLDDPARCLLAWADVLGRGAPQLVAASPGGVVAHVLSAQPVESVPLSRRATFDLRVGQPRFADFVQDLNRDDRADLVLPVVANPRQRRDLYEIWMREDSPAGEPPRFRRVASVPVTLSRDLSAEVGELSDRIEGSFSIPRLSARDVNGDGRVDLVVQDVDRRAFHLQREDGSLSPEPDVSVKLSIFRDTTPAASVRPGRTLVASDNQQFRTRDLDGDEIPDFVISHRRKVWVFHGTPQGPQFTEPSTILKTAADITLLLVIKLDDDPYPDLLMIKVLVPTVATLIAGLFGEWDVDIQAVGYKNSGGRKFDVEPAWKGQLALRLPGILGVMRNPQALLEKFEGLDRRFRREARGDLDGDGVDDVVLLAEDRSRLDAWRAQAQLRQASLDEGMLRDVLFEDENRVWNIDRILGVLTAKAEERVGHLTGGRAPDGSVTLRPAAEWRLVSFDTADVDGDGKAEIVAAYERADETRLASFDVLRVAR